MLCTKCDAYTAERILRDYQLAEDAVQKAFMKVLDNLHKIEEPDCNKTRRVSSYHYQKRRNYHI